MDDLAPLDVWQLQRLVEEPYDETVHPEGNIDLDDRDGESYEPASDEEIDELICEVVRGDS